MMCSCLAILKYMCNIALVIKTQMVNAGLIFKPYMFVDAK